MNYIKLNMDDEAKNFIKSFLSSPAYIEVPGLSDLVSDFVPPPEELRGMSAWAQNNAGDSLGGYLLKTILPACLLRMREAAANPQAQGPIIRMADMPDSGNVQAIAGMMEQSMVHAMTAGQQAPPQYIQPVAAVQPVQQPQEAQPQYGIVKAGPGLQEDDHDFTNVDYSVSSLPGIDNYLKGIERIISQEVNRRVKSEKKVLDLRLKEKDATIRVLQAELGKIREAVNRA